ncbi:MAG TPA: YbaL family putative K(+) efflux transporter [Dongiaceae bacterium]|nr:YbaL family putative K(+) efflux transporter [Dongiaceae bacterium]
MPHDTSLIAAIVAGIVLAFVLGALAHRLRVSPLAGYLLAGVVVGPFTPGFVADQHLVGQLAEIGVILLMFGVGLHFSLKDLLSVRAIALPGAVVQIAVATSLGWGLATFLGWSLGAGIVFGLALSVASTVVLLRAMQERRALQTDEGRIAVGWLIIEDLFMVATLVLLPPLAEILPTLHGSDAVSTAGLQEVGIALAWTFGKVAVFVAIMLVGGRRVVPWILHRVAHTGSRELFRLAVLSIALGIAFGAALLFDVSFALGAFFAGMILSESELSHQAAQETLPLRDAFAVLFFVSVGMLLDPAILVEQFWLLLATLFIITIGKSVAAFFIVRAFRYPRRTALVISASLAQIGEFSFILASLGAGLGLLPEQAQDLILAGAILSILINPAAFFIIDRLQARGERATPNAAPADTNKAETAQASAPTSLRDHCVLVGHGRVGQVISRSCRDAGLACFVIEHRPDLVAQLKADGIEAIDGNAADPQVLTSANLEQARCLFVAVPDSFEAGQVVEQAHKIRPDLNIIVRAHSDAELQHLTRLGATHAVMGERELGLAMVRAGLPGAGTSEPGTGWPRRIIDVNPDGSAQS